MARRAGVWMIAGFFVVITSLISPVEAQAANIECTGAMSGVIDANIIVPAGEFCILLGATVNGHVRVEPGAVGFHAHNSDIRNFVMAHNPLLDIKVLDSRVGQSTRRSMSLGLRSPETALVSTLPRIA